jgi:hypothetical protein
MVLKPYLKKDRDKLFLLNLPVWVLKNAQNGKIEINLLKLIH